MTVDFLPVYRPEERPHPRYGGLRSLHYLILLLLTLPGCNPLQREGTKPNLLFILTDEQRYDTSAPYGNDRIITPNLNALGQESIVFEKAYVTQPVCSPARSSLLTGLYPHATGVTSNNIPLAENIKTLPELVNDPEYTTAYIGKWHLGRELEAWHGFDLRISSEDIYTSDDPKKFSDYQKWLISKGYEPDDKEGYMFTRSYASSLHYEDSKSKFIELEALKFLEQHSSRPFMLYLAFLEPHSPNNGPFNGLHDPGDVVLDETYFMPLTRDMPLRYFMKKGYTYDSSETTEELFAKYWGLVHQVDLSVGVVLQKLKALGLKDNTIVVFTSEHGKMFRKFDLTGKTVMYEQSSRVPWMLRIPGAQPASVSHPVSQIDMVPTILDLMHVPVPVYLHGKSLMPIADDATQRRDPVFVEWNPFPNWEAQVEDCPDWAENEDCEKAVQTQIRTVVTPDGWKLNWSSTDKSQMFNLVEDPKEKSNLFDDPQYASRLQQLQQLITRWQSHTGDSVLFRDEDQQPQDTQK